MIKSILATNFKAFKDPSPFPLSKINLLTGINGRGKSSFLQILLIIKQTLELDEAPTRRITLNGSCVQLGTFEEIKNVSVSVSEHIHFTINIDESNYELILKPDAHDNMSAALQDAFPIELEILRKVHYIAADRVGPQLFYKRSSLPKFLSVGTKGEFVGNVLFHLKEELVNELLYIGNSNNKSQELLIQAGEWINNILDSDNLKLNIKDVGNGLIILSFQFGNNDKEYMPSNVGFGYSYILPIVVAGLISKPGEFLIVENPEAHLHPRAQSKLVQFLVLVARTGVQIFIESHSEHILNSIRVIISDNDSSFVNNDVSVLYFQDAQPRVTCIEIDPDGGIDIWPDNFFDQTKKDLKAILNL
jgi:predicted ATPase